MTCFDVSARHLGTLHIVLLPHTIFHTPLGHTPSFTHNFRTHDLSHKTLSHTPFSLSHTIFHIPLCHTQLFTYNLFYFLVLHHLLCLSFLPRPRYNICCSLLEEVDLWGYPVLELIVVCGSGRGRLCGCCCCCCCFCLLFSSSLSCSPCRPVVFGLVACVDARTTKRQFGLAL